MAINPNARYLVTQTEVDLPDSAILSPENGLTKVVEAGNITLYLDGNLEQVSTLLTTGIVVLDDVGGTVTAATKTVSSAGSVTITNPQGIADNIKIDAADNTSVQKIVASKGVGTPGTASSTLNFIDSANIKLVVTDNAGQDRIDIEVDGALSSGINNLAGESAVNIADTMTLDVSSPETIGEVSVSFNVQDTDPLMGFVYNGTKVVFDELTKSVYTLTWDKDPALEAISFEATPSTSVVGGSQTLSIGFEATNAAVGDVLVYYSNVNPIDPKNDTLQFITPELSDVSSVGLNIITSSSGVLEQTVGPITNTGTFELGLKETQIATHPQVIRVNNASEYIYDTFVYDLSVEADVGSPVLNVVESTMTTTPSVTVGFTVDADDDNKVLVYGPPGAWQWIASGIGTVDSVTIEPLASELSLSINTASGDPMPMTGSQTVVLDFDVETTGSPTLAGSCIYYDGTDVRLGVPSTYSGKNTILFASQMTFPADAVTMTVFFNSPNTTLNSLVATAHGLEITSPANPKSPSQGNLSVELITASGGYNVTITSDDALDVSTSFTVVVYYLYT